MSVDRSGGHGRLADTPMTRGMEGHLERGLATVPTGAVVDVADVTAMAVHLMSDDAHSVTGSVVTVDAGRTAVSRGRPQLSWPVPLLR